MNTMIDQMIEHTIGKEGSYSNNSNDRGGETMWGITIDVARRNGYEGAMRSLPRSTAVSLYRNEYLIKPGFDKVAAISSVVGLELFDTGVNMGPSVPAIWFQEWLNAFNRMGTYYPDIPEDGSIGPRTLSAFVAFRQKRGPQAGDREMLKGLNSDQAVRYKQLSRSRQPNEEFVFGWLVNRVVL